MSLLSKWKETDIFKEITPRMIFIAFSASLAAMNAGYEGGYFSTILVNQFFLGKYGHYTEAAGVKTLDSEYQSVGSGLGSAGTMLGAVFFTPIGERFGRKWAIFGAAVISIIGVIIQCVASGNIWAFIMGKFINNMGTGVANAIVPVYLSECSPGVIRGTITSFYQWFYTFGQFWAYLICYLTEDINSKWSYLSVVVASVFIPTVLLFTSVFLTESPRWLLQQGQVDKAKENYQLIFSKSDHLEFEVMMQEVGKKDGHSSSWADLFKGVNFRRTSLVLAIPCLLNGQGLAFMGNYLVLFLVQIGISNSVMILTIMMAVLLVTNTFSFYGADKFGRRVLLMGSSLIMFSSFFIVAGVGYYLPSTHQNQQVCLAFLFIWCISYGCTWAPLAHITAGELPSAELREKSLSLATFLNFGIGMMISFVNPYMQNTGYGNLQARVGFVYGSVSILAFTYVYFLLPEVKKLPLNIIDTLFERKVETFKFQEEGLKLLEEVKDADELEITSILSSRPNEKSGDIGFSVTEKEGSV
ncbi:hypothetical protein PSN45_003656 [Yamadazyma tenuis]|uniref:Major facilitator superfamily (MFS) profile domain-containing protein n=1 Tax=Candida tenuis (strain ATCC 10573 / BCRC 21748 / CBS 615 / JCM 9827 / NBRC 10315 / NRRL Y-1498 / VKM Y-70) TaxID=590646 RepID=G3B3R2_CANTC|nr:uncharacterized protein CANTEDRAFT_134802 [Yamadazyma tenuis ATCC 10573]EGV64215.1 hypothetical protein CANTEDRAFT_134802 [Yamadazyma tenuis ATCC 10573]WEJ96120.1 hypothetical protein PSN45_003656 [Yamadazyma tenuis]